MSDYLFYSSFLVLFYAYFGYYLLLSILKFSKNTLFYPDPPTSISEAKKRFTFSIIIAAHNEEKRIIRRMDNIADLAFDKKRIQTIIVSDGSNDKTCVLARQYKRLEPVVIDLTQQRGRAFAHNEAVKHADGQILVFTDAETSFDTNFLLEIEKCFLSDPSNSLKSTGCVTGNLFYLTDVSSISQAEGLYWKWEKKLRKLKSNFGILATGSGACLAVRKELYRNLGPIDDCDFTTPLDVIQQGFRVVFAENAFAYDYPPNSIKSEIRGRIRQTSKNFIGTLQRWGIISIFTHPFVSFAIFSHKFLRWFTLYFLIIFLASNAMLLDHAPFYQAFFGLQIAFYALALIGFISDRQKIRLPFISLTFSFCIAALGMGLGILTGLIGKAPRYYE